MVPNLYEKIYDLVKQIPRGKISTYKQIAISLGDPIAARAVGQVLSENKRLDEIPCYRVIHTDGRVGKYRLGEKEKIKRLKKDGVKIISEKVVNFNEVLFTNFKTDRPLMKLREEQEKLRKKVKIIKPKLPKKIRVAGVDVSYKERKAKAAIVVMDLEFNVLKEKTITCNVNFPYIPTYLSYREAPIILKLLKTVNDEFDVLLIDGNGILHPRRFGLASHVGVLLNKPTIGVAKSLLMGKVKDTLVYDGDEVIGAELSFGGKPIYVSAGHLIDLETSVEIVRKFTKKYEPEVLKLAHKLAKL
ncbi:MAG: endonuclease V [Candidatus Aenigmarchaeota archaeon]|nr:endonuclease V [Candidatus Aenigmarchaeota archaeon]